ncbi:MAG: carbohydrate kinase, partial [Verrucomicrobia bacterium]|nr:carbohydrate kinase [Verrucomicrobiota bacterium]
GPSVHLDHFFATQSRRTFTYCKPLLMHKDRPPEELSRLDSKNWTPTPSEVEERICASLETLADRVDVIIVLDQVDASGTGVVTPRVLETVNQIAMARPDLWMIADSRQGLAGWPALIYKMNARELGSMLQQSPPEDPREAGVMAGQLARTTGRHVFVTLAEKGIVGASPDGEVEAAPSLPLRGPIDIVGAGDSVTANLAAALAAGSTLRESLQLANTAASLVIHQLGDTGTASVNQMHDLLFGP